MDRIKGLYKAHLNTPFPDLKGEEISGIDLVLIDSDTAGLISKYIGSRGHLVDNDWQILKVCNSDLQTVIKELNDTDRPYFIQLKNIVEQIIDNG